MPHASTELQLRLNLAHDGITAAELANFQFYCRRVGLSYEDMAAILRTRFINPNTGISARVEALGVSFEVIQALKAGMIADADFIDLLPAGLDPVAYGAHPAAHKRDYGPIIAWIKDEANYARIMGLLVIAKAEDSDDVCSAAGFRVRYANPDPTRHELRDGGLRAPATVHPAMAQAAAFDRPDGRGHHGALSDDSTRQRQGSRRV